VGFGGTRHTLPAGALAMTFSSLLLPPDIVQPMLVQPPGASEERADSVTLIFSAMRCHEDSVGRRAADVAEAASGREGRPSLRAWITRHAHGWCGPNWAEPIARALALVAELRNAQDHAPQVRGAVCIVLACVWEVLLGGAKASACCRGFLNVLRRRAGPRLVCPRLHGLHGPLGGAAIGGAVDVARCREPRRGRHSGRPTALCQLPRHVGRSDATARARPPAVPPGSRCAGSRPLMPAAAAAAHRHRRPQPLC
jgi:hypothetical protein